MCAAACATPAANASSPWLPVMPGRKQPENTIYLAWHDQRAAAYSGKTVLEFKPGRTAGVRDEGSRDAPRAAAPLLVTAACRMVPIAPQLLADVSLMDGRKAGLQHRARRLRNVDEPSAERGGLHRRGTELRRSSPAGTHPQ
jgi:hypothetical protein